jgi:hypothetical protein
MTRQNGVGKKNRDRHKRLRVPCKIPSFSQQHTNVRARRVRALPPHDARLIATRRAPLSCAPLSRTRRAGTLLTRARAAAAHAAS